MPGTFTVKAGGHRFQGPASLAQEAPAFDVGNVQRKFVITLPDGVRPVPNQPYTITLSNGEQVRGVTKAQGATDLLQKDAMQIARILLDEAAS